MRAASIGVAMMLSLASTRLVSAQGAAAPVKLLDYTATPPSTWTPRKPSSMSRLAEFVTPGGSEVVVFYFGKGMGGNVDANIARWRGQFSTPDGSPVPEKITHEAGGKFPITVAEFKGTYRRGIGMGSADSVRTGQTLVATIVETPSGPLFIQLFGPSERVATEREQFVAFVKALQ